MPRVNTPALRGSRILGFGHHQPERVLTNDELSTMVDTNDEWITTRTGIRTRRIAGPDDSVVSMAIEAGRMAIADAGLEPSDIGLVIVASTTHRERSPYTAGRVAAALGMANGPAPIDINTACSGFEYAMALADQSIRVGSSDTALVIGSETLSSIADWTDRSTCVLVGDGAGAVVIGASETAEIGPVSWGSVPHLNEAVLVTRDPEYFTQQGRSIYRWAITEAEGHARKVVEAAGVTLDDIAVFAFHQANLRIIEPLARRWAERTSTSCGTSSSRGTPRLRACRSDCPRPGTAGSCRRTRSPCCSASGAASRTPDRWCGRRSGARDLVSR